MKIKSGRLIISLFLFAFFCAFPVSECKAQSIKQKTGETAHSINLRSSYRNLSLSQVHLMNNFVMRKKDEWGFYGHSAIQHEYEKKSINGNCVVIDHATGLMWHQSGSSEYMSWNNAKAWIQNLNNLGYANYQDWRLPTLEEAVSLLESEKTNNLHIDPVFNDEQWGIWTGDIFSSEGAWSVYFSLGNVRWRVKNRYVRPVRSLN